MNLLSQIHDTGRLGAPIALYVASTKRAPHAPDADRGSDTQRHPGAARTTGPSSQTAAGAVPLERDG